MIATGVTFSAKREFLSGIHQPTDIYKIALYTSEAKLGEETLSYDPLGEVVADGYEPGGKVLAGHSVSEDGGTAILSFKGPSWSNVSITARGALIYNSSKNNRAIAVFDFGKEITSTNSTFSASIPPATKSQGLIRLS